MEQELYHHGVKGMKLGVRRYQDYDGSYTQRGLRRYKDAEKRYDAADKRVKDSISKGERYSQEYSKAKGERKKCQDSNE